MGRELVKPACRLACLSLSALLLFLSYKPAIAILAIAGTARNPTEGRHAGQMSEVDSRENMPRPAKKQHRATQSRVVQRIQKSRTASEEEKTLLHVVQLGSGYDRRGPRFLERVDRDDAKPDYLRLFLPANPGSPHSPPA
jgi:hypothetical protein